MQLRELDEQDREQAWHLTRLAFGGDPKAPVPTDPPLAGPSIGVFDDTGRLVAKAFSRPYEQWWGGRAVPMAGIAGVAVRPEHRGQGLVRRLMDALVPMAQAPISSLFPTAPAIYRPMDWEVVGTLDGTRIPLAALPSRAPAGVELRAATEQDLAAIEALYDARAAASAGWLARSGPSFPDGTKAILELDVVTVAVQQGAVTGYLSYSRGRGYRGGSVMSLWDCIAGTPEALRALLASLAGWRSVAESVTWRGATYDLALFVDRSLPPPTEVQPWMLRVVEPVAAVAARGFAPGTTSAGFSVAGVGYRLEVSGGRGELSVVPAEKLPVLHPRGLALLYAGAARGSLVRTGLADRPVPELEEAFTGPMPEILDYF